MRQMVPLSSKTDVIRLLSTLPQAIKENQKFERVAVSREEALTMFEENKFKVSSVGVLG